jgi:hypothetical protein
MLSDDGDVPLPYNHDTPSHPKHPYTSLVRYNGVIPGALSQLNTHNQNAIKFGLFKIQTLK